jgi:hypothetical protein
VGISNVTAIIVNRNTTSGRLSVAAAVNWSFGWYTARQATTATGIDNTSSTFTLINQQFLGNYYIHRDFMSFNTGDSLPSDAIISSASFVSYLVSLNAYHDTERKAVLVPTTQQSATNLVLADFDELTLNNPIEIGRFPLDAAGTKTVDFAAEHFYQIKRSGEVSNNDVDVGWTLLAFRGDLDVDITPIPTFIDINCAFLDIFFGPYAPPYLAINYALRPDPVPVPKDQALLSNNGSFILSESGDYLVTESFLPGGGGGRKSASDKVEKDTSELWEIEASIYNINNNPFKHPIVKKKYIIQENDIKVIIGENISLQSLETLNENIIVKLLTNKVKE